METKQSVYSILNQLVNQHDGGHSPTRRTAVECERDELLRTQKETKIETFIGCPGAHGIGCES